MFIKVASQKRRAQPAPQAGRSPGRAAYPVPLPRLGQENRPGSGAGEGGAGGRGEGGPAAREHGGPGARLHTQSQNEQAQLPAAREPSPPRNSGLGPSSSGHLTESTVISLSVPIRAGSAIQTEKAAKQKARSRGGAGGRPRGPGSGAAGTFRPAPAAARAQAQTLRRRRAPRRRGSRPSPPPPASPRRHAGGGWLGRGPALGPAERPPGLLGPPPPAPPTLPVPPWAERPAGPAPRAPHLGGHGGRVPRPGTAG